MLIRVRGHSISFCIFFVFRPKTDLGFELLVSNCEGTNQQFENCPTTNSRPFQKHFSCFLQVWHIWPNTDLGIDSLVSYYIFKTSKYYPWVSPQTVSSISSGKVTVTMFYFSFSLFSASSRIIHKYFLCKFFLFYWYSINLITHSDVISSTLSNLGPS